MLRLQSVMNLWGQLVMMRQWSSSSIQILQDDNGYYPRTVKWWNTQIHQWNAMKDKNKSLIHEYSMILDRFKENHEKYWKTFQLIQVTLSRKKNICQGANLHLKHQKLCTWKFGSIGSPKGPTARGPTGGTQPGPPSARTILGMLRFRSV